MEEKKNKDLIKHLEYGTRVLTPTLKKALESIDRMDFVEEDYKPEAYNDHPLPIGFGQTISQPTVVVMMLSLLSPEKGDRILDVGCGSGWTTVLLGYLVGKEGEVVAIDVIEEFVELTRNRAAAYQEKAPNIGVFHSSEEDAIYSDRFDKILVSASFSSETDIPEKMKESLKEGGRMVAPVGHDLVVFKKEDGLLVEDKKYSDMVSFVPYIRENPNIDL